VGSSDPDSSQIPARGKTRVGPPHEPTTAPTARSAVDVRPPYKFGVLQGGASARRLVADQVYFGLQARALRAGAERALERIAAHPEQPQVDLHSLGADFRLEAAASLTLLRALVAGELLHPDGTGGYRPTARFREYALACVVAPLSRARAKALIDAACELAARINADWTRNRFRIKAIAVSGSYMSGRDTLPELSLWIVVRPREEVRPRHARHSLSRSDAAHQILTAVKAVSSFIHARIVEDREDVRRPFSVVFEAREDIVDSSVPAWERVRSWGASISRRLAAR
jgi:hypothetical protein